MNLSRYECSDSRRRLEGRTEQRGTQTGFSTLGAFAFGVPFVGVGTLIILMGTKVITVDPKSVHAPYWVLTVFGVVFALGGFMIWAMAWRQRAADHRRMEAASRHGGEPALMDFNWDVRGFDAPRWKPAITAVFGAAFLTLFLSMFNYWAFFAKGPWPVKIIVIIFDLVLIAAWWAALMRLGRSLKFGGSRIEFLNFPYQVGKPAIIRWWPARGIQLVNKGTFTLRCVEECFETSGSGRNRSKHLVHEEVWSGTWRAEQTQSFSSGQFADLRYELPEEVSSTQLSTDKPVFWELEVKLDLPGLDFQETYLVPIYSMG